MKNVETMVQCGQWRLLYSKRELKPEEQQILGKKLDGLMFSRGSSLEDLQLQVTLKEVYIREPSLLRADW